ALVNGAYLFFASNKLEITVLKASKVLSPKKGDKWKSGFQLVQWEYKLPGIDTVNLFLVKRNINPPLYTLLGQDISYKSGKSSVHLPSNMLPGSDYSVMLTGQNPYNVYAESQYFSVLPSDDDDCYKYLYDDGAATPGPTPSDNPPTVEPEPEPEPSLGPEPPLEPDCDDCEDCSEDEMCGECFANERCECDGCETLTDSHKPFVTEPSGSDGKGVVDVGSINKIAGF
ncbi:unnamed protein product, partial [Pneumocystis jirovecii]